MIRLFTALEIPDEVADRLIQLQTGLHGARWIEREAFHITLRFIGEVAEDVAADIDKALEEEGAADAFELHLSGVGQFGNKHPHALWAGVAPNPALSALQTAHERLMRKTGLAPETRTYKPHVTLARLKNIEPEPVWRYIETNNLFESLPFKVWRVGLFSARLKGGGPYRLERVYPVLGSKHT